MCLEDVESFTRNFLWNDPERQLLGWASPDTGQGAWLASPAGLGHPGGLRDPEQTL